MTRSEQMARVKGENTKPEKLLRAALWSRGLRYRRSAKLPVRCKPDLIFPGRKVAVFIDGCFWHGCPEHYVRPRTRHDFWAEKLAANVDRDRRITRSLEDAGWAVIRLWEHEIEESIGDACNLVGRGLEGSYTERRSWRVVRVDSVDASEDRERRHLEDLWDPSSIHVETGPRTPRSGRKPSILDNA